MSLFGDLEQRAQQVIGGITKRAGSEPGRQVLASNTDEKYVNDPQQKPKGVHHDLPVIAGEDPEVAAARQLLQQSEIDQSRQLIVIRRVLDKTDYVRTNVARQLLQLLQPFEHEYPALSSVITSRLARIDAEERGPGTGTGTKSAPDPDPIATTASGGGGGGHGVGGHGAITPLNDTMPSSSMEGEYPGITARQAANRLADWNIDKTFANFREAELFDLDDMELFKSLTAVDPTVPLLFRRLMVGQLLGEQSGPKPNRNFGGFESRDPNTRPPDAAGKIWTRMKRSDEITEAQYRANHDKYYDNPAFGPTIRAQLDDVKKRAKSGMLNVRWFAVRPAYDSWPMQPVHARLMSAYHQLKSSKWPEHNDTAAKAWAGGAKDYHDMLEINMIYDGRKDDGKKTPAPPHDVDIKKQAYNGTGSYWGTIRASVTSALVNSKYSP